VLSISSNFLLNSSSVILDSTFILVSSVARDSVSATETKSLLFFFTNGGFVYLFCTADDPVFAVLDVFCLELVAFCLGPKRFEFTGVAGVAFMLAGRWYVSDFFLRSKVSSFCF
jgi:hypothetical protein